VIPASVAHDQPWQRDAACRGSDPGLFDTCCAAKTVPREAATLCAACPVRRQCYDLAMHIEAGTAPTYRFGIFGGTSPQQRADAWPQWATDHGISPHARRSGLAPCGTAAAYKRHKQHGEPIDEACAAAYRQRSQAQRDKAAAKKRRQRARHAQEVAA
jgi:WhiB family redox-sensing transcriptional regulator